MKKIKLLMALVIIMSVILTACSPTQAPAEPAAPVDSEPADVAPVEEQPADDAPAAEAPVLSGKVVYAFPADGVQDSLRPEQVAMFNEVYPDITVELLAVPEDGYDQKNLSMIVAGEQLDIFGSGEVFVAPYIQNGVSLPLTDLIANDPNFHPEDFVPNIIDYFKDSEGNIHMLPGPYDVQRIYYNKKLFDDAGLAYPEDSWTWADFKSMAEKLTVGEGVNKQFGFLAGTRWYVFMPYVWANGGNMWSEDGTTCLFNSPETVEALDWYVDFMRKGLSPSPSELTGLGMSAGDMFTTGKVAMVSSGGWDIPYFNEITDFEWGQIALPASPNGRATTLHLQMNLISAKTEFPAQTWAWLSYLTSPEMYTYEVLKYGQGVPPRISTTQEILNNPPADADPQALLNLQIGFESAKFGRTLPKIINFAQIRDDVVYPNLDLFWNGEIATAQEVGDLICSQMILEPMK